MFPSPMPPHGIQKGCDLLSCLTPWGQLTRAQEQGDLYCAAQIRLGPSLLSASVGKGQDRLSLVLQPVGGRTTFV